MIEFFLFLILFCFLGFFITFYRHWKTELIRLDMSLQHERYGNRMLVDFTHDLLEFSPTKEKDHDSLVHLIFESVVFTAIRGTRSKAVAIFKYEKETDCFSLAFQTGLFPFLEGMPADFEKLSKIELLQKHLENYSYSRNTPIFKKVLEKGSAVIINDFPIKSGNLDYSKDLVAPKSIILTPIFFEGDLRGCLLIANPRNEKKYTEIEIKLANAISEQLTMSIQMCRLIGIQAEKETIDLELDLAGSVQKMLLPNYIPQWHSLDIDAFYLPAQKIGGDLYDVFDLGGGRIAFIIADVSGHGISAALLMSICRTNFQHIAKNSINAADLLRRLNRAMVGSFKRGMFLTIICAFIDVQRNTFSVARGGHEKAFLIAHQSDKQIIEKLDSQGLAIGITTPEVFDKTITEITRPYKSGDTLVFYTDGLTEALNQNDEEFGEERLKNVLDSVDTQIISAKEINAQILFEQEKFIGTRLRSDDMTIVTVRAK